MTHPCIRATMRFLALLLAPLLVLAMLAGCTGTDGGGGTDGPTQTTTSPGGPGFAPQSHHDEAESEHVPGVVVEGEMRTCDILGETLQDASEPGFCVDAAAANRGNGTAYVRVVCVEPWSENLTRDGEPVLHREPMGVCGAFRLGAFGPGGQQMYGPKWNQTLWDQDMQRYGPAPQGTYVWHVTFEVFTSEEGEGRHLLEMEFPVVVGPT